MKLHVMARLIKVTGFSSPQASLFLPLTIFLLLLPSAGYAQTATDGSTSAGGESGAPSGSDALSGIESVNLFNGHLNVHVPIMGIGGRGAAQTGMVLAIDNQWSVKTNFISNQYQHLPQLDVWSTIRPGYGPGVLVGRRAGDQNHFSSAGTRRTKVYDQILEWSLWLGRHRRAVPLRPSTPESAICWRF